MLANTDIKHADVVLFFNTKYKLDIDRSTITKIWQNREKWLTALSNSNIFRCRSVQFPELDKALQIWTSQAVTILQQKGLELAQMLNISEDQFLGEASSAPLATLPEERLKLRNLLAAYNKEDIYNADKTGLFFRIKPDQTLGTGGAIAGRKKVLILTHETNLNEDNFNDEENNEEEMLSNIELVYLPPNTTAHLQPMDAGIIHSFKSKYKKEYCKHLIRKFNAGVDYTKNKLNLKEAIEYIADETDNVRNYFQILDHEIPAEENLTEEQIVNLVQLEKKEESEEDDDSDNEIPPVSIKEAVGSLETFIIYFQQQTDPEFDVNDLRIFRKYLKVSKVQEFNSKKQSTLDMFFES
ncbi:unnamed protein product [Rhizophagus irregularis]|nr:unnamed protein product [Rhizophagus irregularis]